MAGIISRVKMPVLNILDSLVYTDDELRELITYRHFQSVALDPVTKKQVTKYTDYNVDAVRMRHTQETVKSGAASVEIGQPYFLVKADLLPDYRKLTKKDRVLDQFGNDLAVYDITGVYSIIVGITVVA